MQEPEGNQHRKKKKESRAIKDRGEMVCGKAKKNIQSEENTKDQHATSKSKEKEGSAFKKPQLKNRYPLRSPKNETTRTRGYTIKH